MENINIKESKKRLKSSVASNLASAFRNFKNWLDQDVDTLNQLIQLEGRYHDTQKYFNLNVAEKNSLDIELSKIRKAFLDLIDQWKPTKLDEDRFAKRQYSVLKNYLVNFPWPDLINKGLGHLFNIKEIIEGFDSDISKRKITKFAEEYASRNQIKNHRNIQLSIISREKFFIYHDVEILIGAYASHNDIVSGIDIYNVIFGYPFGSLCWLDNSSNYHGSPETDIRENFALFSDAGDLKVVIELHNEK